MEEGENQMRRLQSFLLGNNNNNLNLNFQLAKMLLDEVDASSFMNKAVGGSEWSECSAEHGLSMRKLQRITLHLIVFFSVEIT